MSSILLIGSPGTGKTRIILKYIKSYDKILWVSTTEGAREIRKKLEGVRSKVWIVDTHTWDQNLRSDRRDLVVSNPMNLNEVSIAIATALDSLKSEYFVAFDSISGLLLYNTPQKVITFLRNVIVRINSENSVGIFTLVKDAHDKYTETAVSLIFPNIIELKRIFEESSAKRIMRIIKASQHLKKEVGEIKIVEDDVIIPKEFDNFIKTQLNILTPL